MLTALLNVRSREQSGKHMLALGFSAFDPILALVHPGRLKRTDGQTITFSHKVEAS
jgi:hypothetical protein